MTWILERVSDVESKYLAYEIIEGARIAHGMSAGLIYIWRSQPLTSCSTGFTVIMPVSKHGGLEMSRKTFLGWDKAMCMLHCPIVVSGRRLHISRYSRLFDFHRGKSCPVQRNRTSESKTVRDGRSYFGSPVVERKRKQPKHGKNDDRSLGQLTTTATTRFSRPRELQIQWSMGVS